MNSILHNFAISKFGRIFSLKVISKNKAEQETGVAKFSSLNELIEFYYTLKANLQAELNEEEMKTLYAR